MKIRRARSAPHGHSGQFHFRRHHSHLGTQWLSGFPARPHEWSLDHARRPLDPRPQARNGFLLRSGRDLECRHGARRLALSRYRQSRPASESRRRRQRHRGLDFRSAGDLRGGDRSRGVVYAGTSPDGKVYRIENGRATEYFAPGERYIWALAFAPDGAYTLPLASKARSIASSPRTWRWQRRALL